MLRLLTCLCFGLLSKNFPHTEKAAQDLVKKVRTQRAIEGRIDTEWELDDYLVAVKARLGPIQRVGCDALQMATNIFHALWPNQAAPKTVRGLVEKLADAEARLDEWRESAARVGADEAMSYVLSWYETLDLSKFRGTREGLK